MDYAAPGGGLEYSGGYRGVMAVAGRRVGGPRGYATTAGSVPHTRAMASHIRDRALPPTVSADLRVAGRALPYAARIRNGDGWDVFGRYTEWQMDDDTIGIHLNHGSLVGAGTVVEDDGGLWLTGRIFGAFANRVAGMDRLSIGFRSLASAPRPDGGTDHLRVHLTEVSVTDRPMAEGTTAAIYG